MDIVGVFFGSKILMRFGSLQTLGNPSCLSKSYMIPTAPRLVWTYDLDLPPPDEEVLSITL